MLNLIIFPLVPVTIFNFNLFTGTNCVGVVDYGLQESTDQLATQALVFMVVALNDTFKLPIAHFSPLE
jgi:hypothetical protein